MTQKERRIFLIKYLLGESRRYGNIPVPSDAAAQKKLLRSLVNVRPPRPIGQDFLTVQDEYLRGEIAAKKITDFADLTPEEPGIYLRQGDIITLKCGAIVNAANSGLTGCYVPCHGCIDNAIHTFAGVQLRLDCQGLIEAQGHGEETGGAKITPAYNLPCDFILHTVGPIVSGKVTDRERGQLASCYRACLALAEKNKIKSVAFCCISTGEFRFPNRLAAEIAVKTVREYRGETEVIFNVFKDADYQIYRELLG